ncbi:MAG: TerD family protein [Oscillospiraceae bacterium]|nr:TerD family protein [Oscillospiraceae bacterium]
MQDELLTELEQKLNCLQGLAEVKSDICAWVQMLCVCQNEISQGLSAVSMPLHLVFMGESGTGKTETGRIVARSYHSLGLLTGGRMVAENAAVLTAQTIQAQAQRILGNVWMLDHVDLMPDDLLEHLLEILQWENFAVIFSGTKTEIERMLYKFPVLRLKFCKYLHFTDAQPMGFYLQNRNSEDSESSDFTGMPEQSGDFFQNCEKTQDLNDNLNYDFNQKEGDSLRPGARMDLTPYVRNEIRIRFLCKKLKQHMELDVYVFLLREEERQDEDLIFFGNACSHDGSIRVMEQEQYPECGFSLNKTDPGIQKIAVCFSAYGNNPTFDFSQMEEPVLQVFQGNTQIAYMDLSHLQAERTVVAVELYRYRNSWKLLATAEGCCDGLRELGARFGIETES